MKIRLNIIVIILTLGYFLSPTVSYACGTKTEKTCCKKATNSKSEKKECCNGKHSNNKNNGCGGRCGHSNCTSSTSSNFSIIALNEINFKNNSFNFSNEKQNYFYSEIFLSSGFYSLWLIPKIS